MSYVESNDIIFIFTTDMLFKSIGYLARYEIDTSIPLELQMDDIIKSILDGYKFIEEKYGICVFKYFQKPVEIEGKIKLVIDFGY